MCLNRVIWLWALCLPACAQSVSALVEEALKNNREVLAAQKRYEAARQRPSRAASLPDPMLSLGYTSVGSPRPLAGIGTAVAANAGVMVSQELPAPGKLKLRGEIAQKEADAEFQQYLGVRLDVEARVKIEYHELHHAHVAAAIVRRNQALLRNLITVSQSRYSVGRAPQQDIFRAQAQYAILETQAARIEQDRITKEAEMNALLNRPLDTSIEVPEEMAVGQLGATLDELLAHARAEAPVIKQEQETIQRNELAVNLARRGYAPDYTVSGGYFNQAGMPAMYQFRVDLRLPAYFWRKQRAEVAEQVYTLSESRHAYEASRQTLAAQIKGQYTAAQTALKLMGLYEKSVSPQARLAFESSLASYETGAVDFLNLITNFMAVVDYDLNYHEELMRFHVARARLEELTGMELEK